MDLHRYVSHYVATTGLAAEFPNSFLEEMIKENLIAERIAIDSYRELIHYIDDKDPTTSQMLKTILAVEEEHADELADLLVVLPR